jgi:hypothetical protein
VLDEAGLAQPVHRSVATDKSGGLHVPDQAMVLEQHRASFADPRLG